MHISFFRHRHGRQQGLCVCFCLCCHCWLQAFARLSAVYGGTYMLHKSDAKVEFDEAGKAVGVSSEGETAKCKFVVGDASYFPGKSRVTSRVVRALCVLSHPLPNTDNAHSAQIILPQKQIGRRSGGGWEPGVVWPALQPGQGGVCSSTPHSRCLSRRLRWQPAG